MSRPPGQALMRSGQARVLPLWMVALRDPDIGGTSYIRRVRRYGVRAAICHPDQLDHDSGLCRACCMRERA